MIFSHLALVVGWMSLCFFINAGVRAHMSFFCAWLMETNASRRIVHPRLEFNLEDGVWINLLLLTYFKKYLAEWERLYRVSYFISEESRWMLWDLNPSVTVFTDSWWTLLHVYIMLLDVSHSGPKNSHDSRCYKLSLCCSCSLALDLY